MATEAWPDGNNPDEVEVDFWELSRLHCYNNLSSWKELDQIICDSIDEDHDLMKVWEDTYAQVSCYCREGLKFQRLRVVDTHLVITCVFAGELLATFDPR